DASPRPEGELHRQSMSDDTGPRPPIGVGKPALIGVNPAAPPKIIEVADRPVAGRGSEKLHAVLREATLDQQSMERLEKGAGERMRSASALPGGAMQRFQVSEER